MTRPLISFALSFLTALWGTTSFAPARASAFCTTGNSCPTAGAGLEVFDICGNTSVSSCVGTYDVSGADEIVLARALLGSFPYQYFVVGACVKNGAVWQFHRLRHSSYRGGGMIGWNLPNVDSAICLGNGDDIVRVQRDTDTCGGVATRAWSYGVSNYWLEIHLQSGSDGASGGTGHDRICGGDGDDDADLGPSGFGLRGGPGADDLDGWSGDDVMDSYVGGGDQAWGYWGVDIVEDLVGNAGGDAVYGEGDADACVYIDEAYSPWIVSGGYATCNSSSCVCGTLADDSCYDRSYSGGPSTNRYGVEILDGIATTACGLD